MDNIASALSRATHITAIGQATRSELLELPTDALLMYLIDSAPVDALYHLADQFGVTGWRGWNLAQDEAAKRQIIKRAITLHKKKGTPWAVKEIIRLAGFVDPQIREGVGVEYDGEQDYSGGITYSGGNWATFRVIVGVGPDTTVNAALVADMRAMIEEYKSARSTLLDVSFSIALADQLDTLDILEYDDNELVDRLTPGIFYNAVGNYDGVSMYNNGADSVYLRIFRNGIIIEDGYF